MATNTIAIVLVAMIKIAKRSLKTVLHYVVALMSFIAIFFLNIPFPFIILSAIILAFIIRWLNPKLFEQKNNNGEKEEEEKGFYLTTTTVIPGTEFHILKLIRQVGIFLLLWCIPMLLFFGFSVDFVFWKNLSLFFTQAAFVTFGGLQMLQKQLV